MLSADTVTVMSKKVPPALSRLASIQLDALRELANIGAGHAATALSEMTGRTVRIGVPVVSLTARDALNEIIGNREAPLVLVKVRSGGDYHAGFVMVLNEPGARDLTNILLSRHIDGTRWMDDIGASALKEVGNVLGAAYLNAFASITGWTIPVSTPSLIYARAQWAMSLICQEEGRCDVAICLDTSMHIEGAGLPVRGHLLLFPSVDSVENLLAAVGAA